MSTTLTEKLITLRKNKGLTQKELAEKLNYSDKVISKWERGESLPNINAVKDLASFYHISIDDLLDDNNIPKEDEVSLILEPTLITRRHPLVRNAWLYPLVPWIVFLYLRSMDLALFFLMITCFNLIAYSFYNAYAKFDCEYEGHTITLVNHISKSELLIDGKVVDGYYGAFALGVKLTGIVGHKRVKASFSCNVVPKCRFFIETVI